MKQVLSENKINGTYVEAFAGGAGLAINLLLTDTVNNIILNDFDVAIYSFWWALTKRNSAFLAKFDRVNVDINEWHFQKKIFDELSNREKLNNDETVDLGFATYFLNRTNFSGILRGATPIGGLSQTGAWKIDCQFNKERLRPLLESIGQYADKITVTRFNMITDFQKLVVDENSLIFIDPPYVKEGRRLYLPIKHLEEHKILSKEILNSNSKWVLTYDLNEKLMPMYMDVKHKYKYKLRYYVKKKRDEYEFLAISNDLKFPNNALLNDCQAL